jgi:hypothetical protein
MTGLEPSHFAAASTRQARKADVSLTGKRVQSSDRRRQSVDCRFDRRLPDQRAFNFAFSASKISM